MVPDNPKDPTLLFVYNGDSSLFARAADLVWKIARPETYPCSLCKITYGPVRMKDSWKQFVQSLPYRIEFLHRDEFRRAFPELSQLPLPAILLALGYDMRVLIGADQLRKVDNPDFLQDLVAAAVPQLART